MHPGLASEKSGGYLGICEERLSGIRCKSYGDAAGIGVGYRVSIKHRSKLVDWMGQERAR